MSRWDGPRSVKPPLTRAANGTRLAPAVRLGFFARRAPLHAHLGACSGRGDFIGRYLLSSLDGHGSHSGNWGGYWGKQGPELLDHRLALYGAEQRMVFGANTYRQFVRLLGPSTEESEVGDPWVTRMRSIPATVVSTTLEGPLDWPNATVVSGNGVDVVARLKEGCEVPLRSHGSLSLNRALMAAGLVDRLCPQEKRWKGSEGDPRVRW